jgi:hypothetical protein
LLRNVPVLLNLLAAQLFLLLVVLADALVFNPDSMLLLGVHLVLMCVLVALADALLGLTLVLQRMVSHSPTAGGLVGVCHRLVLISSVLSLKVQPLRAQSLPLLKVVR